MVMFPYTYGDYLSVKDARIARTHFVRNMTPHILCFLIIAMPAIAKEDISPTPKGVADRTAPPPGAGNGGAPGKPTSPPVLANNLPPTAVTSGKASLTLGAGSLIWTTVMAVSTKHPALYLAAAGLYTYFLL